MKLCVGFWWWLLQPHEKVNGDLFLFSTSGNIWECIRPVTTVRLQHNVEMPELMLSWASLSGHASMKSSSTAMPSPEVGSFCFQWALCFFDKNIPQVTCLKLSGVVFQLHCTNSDSTKPLRALENVLMTWKRFASKPCKCVCWSCRGYIASWTCVFIY